MASARPSSEFFKLLLTSILSQVEIERERERERDRERERERELLLCLEILVT